MMGWRDNEMIGPGIALIAGGVMGAAKAAGWRRRSERAERERAALSVPTGSEQIPPREVQLSSYFMDSGGAVHLLV